MNKLKKIVVQAMKKSAKGIYDLSAKNAMENENFFRDYLKDNIYGFTFTSDSSHTGRKPYEWDVLFYPSDNLLANTKFIIKEKNEDYEIRYYSDGPTNDGTILMITFHDINLPILNKVVKYVNRDLPELIEQNKKEKTGKMAKIISKEILKSAKANKKADIDQRLSYGHFLKEEDENKLPKFNTLEDIKKYIKSTNRFPDNFFYKGGLFTEDEYDLDGMYVTYGSPEIDKAIVINTPNNRYNHKGNYKNLDIEIKEEDSPDFRTDINYTLPIKVYEKYFPKKQSSKANKMTKKAFTYKDEKAALAKFLNIKEEDLTKNEENFYFGLPEFTTKNGEEYRISASESVIRGAVAESLENLFNDLGLDEFKEKVLPYVGDMERYFSVSESKFYDQALEELRNVDEIEDPSEEQIEAKQKEIIDNYGSAEEFFIEVGDEYIKEMINYGDASFDFEKMAEDVISEYGAGHELASYDNDTNEIEYNGKTYYIFRQQ